MAGQGAKKEKARKELNNKIMKLAIILITIFYVIVNAYSVIINGYEYKRSDIIGFLILTIINFTLYRLIDALMGSYFHLPLVDLLIINLGVMVGINFHWKFWYLYLIVPFYLFTLVAKKAYEHVKTVGKPAEGEDTPEQNTNQKSRKDGQNSEKKQKTKMVKIH